MIADKKLLRKLKSALTGRMEELALEIEVSPSTVTRVLGGHIKTGKVHDKVVLAAIEKVKKIKEESKQLNKNIAEAIKE